jgi:hypothetical protein
MTRFMCETIASKLEKSWRPIIISSGIKCARKDRTIASKRQAELDIPTSKEAKKLLCESFHHQGVLNHMDSKLDLKNGSQDPKSEMTSLCVDEKGVMLSESVPSSPPSNQQMTAMPDLQVPPDTDANHSQTDSQNDQTNGGPKLFVSEMLINQRALYLELESRFSGDHQAGETKFQLCESSLDIPDITFSATSCALVFDCSEFWANMQVRLQILAVISLKRILQYVTLDQRFPDDFPGTLQEILRQLHLAGFKRCLLLLNTQVKIHCSPKHV